jgi:predicted transcriptional regulator
MKYYLTEAHISFMDKKTAILQYLSKNPGIKNPDIDLGINNSSLGIHLRNLQDKGLVVKTQSGGWQVSENYIMTAQPLAETPIDLVGVCVRKMIDV